MKNADKTHCPKGHPYDDENTYVNPNTGSRSCKTCKRERLATTFHERRILSPYSLEERLMMFMDKTKFSGAVPDVPDLPPGRCLLWDGAKFRDGYGKFGRGTAPGPRTLLAHRWLYQVIHGELDDDTEIDHLCGVKLCVNLRHLEPVDRWEHVERTVERRRWREQRDAELSLSRR